MAVRDGAVAEVMEVHPNRAMLGSRLAISKARLESERAGERSGDCDDFIFVLSVYKFSKLAIKTCH
jgi:hypothetical protein